jgi:hypothetical protein
MNCKTRPYRILISLRSVTLVTHIIIGLDMIEVCADTAQYSYRNTGPDHNTVNSTIH